MNDDDDLTTTPGPGSGSRVEVLLRRAGVVEEVPPPHVWEAVRREAGRSPSAFPSARAARRRRAAWARPAQLLAAAAAGALVAWAGTSLVDRDPRPQLLASGQLAALAGDGSEGRAEVVTVGDQQRLRVELAQRPDAGDGYLEVWLLRPDVSGMVTLGVLEGEQGEFVLPVGLDLAEYAVVDISREHMDGDPSHGGDSLVRGEVG